jgi:hypothetical protein
VQQRFVLEDLHSSTSFKAKSVFIMQLTLAKVQEDIDAKEKELLKVKFCDH